MPEEPEPDPETVSDWTEVHERMMQLRSERARHEYDVCRWLLAAERLGAHARAGCASLTEYADQVLGLSARETEERLRVGRVLGELPSLAVALASGELCWSAVRELSRIATPETEEAWLCWSRGRRARDIQRAVRGRTPGDRPQDRPDPSRMSHRLSFEVRSETMALFRDLQARVRADLGERVDDDTLLFEIARRALGGPEDEGRSSYQVAVMRCDACGEASIDAAGHSHALDSALVEMISCDSQELGQIDGAPPNAMPAQAGDGSPPNASPHNASPHVGAPTSPTATPKRRATQTIPPATRRQVMRRDHKRCVVPGCGNYLFLDLHHVRPRSEGGSHDPDGIASLCGSHHRKVHAGQLVIEGTAKSGFIFRHADGTPYGAPMSPAAVDVAQQAFLALENMGFKQTRARALVDAVLRADAPSDLPAFLHAALRASS